MIDPTDVYGLDFFRDYVVNPLPHRQLGSLMHHMLGRRSFVVDVGCGPGLAIDQMRLHDHRVLGLDGSEWADRTAVGMRLGVRVELVDLRTWTPADDLYANLVICTEVAEHIEPEYADRLIETLSILTGDHLFFTAATPGQEGLGHVNEQPREYWLEKFAARGLRFDRERTADVRNHPLMDEIKKSLPWIYENAMWFRRGD